MKSNFPLISVIVVLTVLFSSFLKNDSSEYDFKNVFFLTNHGRRQESSLSILFQKPINYGFRKANNPATVMMKKYMRMNGYWI